MSTELETKLQELREQHSKHPNFVGVSKLIEQCIALASLPQQDVGADVFAAMRLAEQVEPTFVISGPVHVPHFWHTYYEAGAFADTLNAAFAAGRSVPSPVGQAATVDQVKEVVKAWILDNFDIEIEEHTLGSHNLQERLSALFTHPPKAGVLTDEEVVISRNVFDFLHGTADIEGYSFGDDHRELNGRFWWRKFLVSLSSKP